MNDHQLSVNATPQEVNDYLKFWAANGNTLNQIEVVKDLLENTIRLIIEHEKEVSRISRQ